jgi:hypothetical protein
MFWFRDRIAGLIECQVPETEPTKVGLKSGLHIGLPDALFHYIYDITRTDRLHHRIMFRRAPAWHLE